MDERARGSREFAFFVTTAGEEAPGEVARHPVPALCNNWHAVQTNGRTDSLRAPQMIRRIHPRSPQGSLRPHLVAVAAALGVGGPLSSQELMSALPTARLPASGFDSRGIAMRDVDGDGDVDVLFSTSRRGMRLLRNVGASGHFRDDSALAFATVSTAAGSRLAVDDLDGDGDADLLRPCYGTQDELYLNDGTGTFSAATATGLPPDAAYSLGIALGDVDADGDLDVALASDSVIGSTAAVRLYLNSGNASFTDVSQARLPAQRGVGRDVRFLDAEGDGDLDLVTADPLQLWINDGSGSFMEKAAALPSAGPFVRLAVGDLDGDGDEDLIADDSSIGVALDNDGAATFSARSLPPVFGYGDFGETRLVDADGDGDLDVLYARGSQYTPGSRDRFLRNDGNWQFVDVSATALPPRDGVTYAVAVGDADGDGDADVVVGGVARDELWLNDGAGVFAMATGGRLPPPMQATAQTATAADLDGDGDRDLLVAGLYLEPQLWLGDGTGQWSGDPAARLPSLRQVLTRQARSFDANGDGAPELVLAASGQNQLLLNDGTGRFSRVTSIAMPLDNDDSYDIVPVDVDADGDLDLVVANRDQNRLYLNSGAGSFTDATAGRLPVSSATTAAVATGDVDADGDVDLLLAHRGTANQLLLNDGQGSFSPAPTFPGSRPSAGAWLADVDGDGDLDALVRDTNAMRVLINDGLGGFTDATTGRFPPPPAQTTVSAAAPADIDSDGDIDVLVGHRLTSPGAVDLVRLYLNDGGGTFVDVTGTRSPSNVLGHVSGVPIFPLDIVLEDFDSDRDPDALLLTSTAPVVLFNLTRHLDAVCCATTAGALRLDLYARCCPGTSSLGAVAISAGIARTTVPGIGELLLQPASIIGLPVIPIPGATGLAQGTLAIPNVPSLVGGAFASQAIVVGPGAALGFTNARFDVVVR